MTIDNLHIFGVTGIYSVTKLGLSFVCAHNTDSNKFTALFILFFVLLYFIQPDMCNSRISNVNVKPRDMFMIFASKRITTKYVLGTVRCYNCWMAVWWCNNSLKQTMNHIEWSIDKYFLAQLVIFMILVRQDKEIIENCAYYTKLSVYRLQIHSTVTSYGMIWSF